MNFSKQRLGGFEKSVLLTIVKPGLCATLSLAFMLSFSSAFVALAESKCDVMVYGATPGGIAAAVAAAKGGKEVLLIEPTNRVGGMLTSGLSYTDFRSFESLTGFFLDFSERVEGHYKNKYGDKSQQVKDCFRGTHGEPSVNLIVLEEMISEQSTVTLIKRSRLDSVALGPMTLGRQRITSVTVRNEKGVATTFYAKLFIDGSYEGDLMALAEEPYHVGRESRAQYGEPLAGNERGEADGQVQGYNFRLTMTDVEANKRMPVAPDGYNRDDFVGVLAHFESKRLEKVFADGHDGIYRAHSPCMPNGKTDVNDTPQAPVRLSMPDINDAYPDGHAAKRAEIVHKHYYFNIGLLYFLQNDSAVPDAIRRDARRFGWCKDEFQDTHGIPPQLYIREARRMVGQHVFTGRDTEQAERDARARLHSDSIATGDYIHNCHGTGREGSRFDGKHVGEFYKTIQPFQVPYGVVVPQKTENLLVPVACSASHFGFGALRLEPMWCSLGQATGWAAVLCLETDTTVQGIDVRSLQQRLHQDRSATIYVSDVPPSSHHFQLVQAIGTAGGLHGLDEGGHPLPASLGGQYREAFLGHAVGLDKPMDGKLAAKWSKSLNRDIAPPIAASGKTLSRGEWLATNPLTAGAKLRIDFPDLPNTLAGLATNTHRVPVLSAELPANYSSEKRYPLFVYLKGYDGGRDDTPNMARWIVGPDDFIAVSLPLFKKRFSEDNRVTPINSDDFDVTRTAYRVMLEKLYSLIPNIDVKRSCIGGHSNGAHALGVLLAGGDDFLLEHFDSFYLHEGGMALFTRESKTSNRIQKSRLLVIVGEESMGQTVPLREGIPLFTHRIRETTVRLGLSCKVVTMIGYGHDVPPEYHRLIGQWARGEELVDIPKREAEIAKGLSFPLSRHPDVSEWNEFLTPDLTNMKVPGAVWDFDGRLLTAKDHQIIWTKAHFKDCALDFEFKLQPGADGGVLLYNSDEKEWKPNSIEIQLSDDSAIAKQEEPGTSHCGAFFGHQVPAKIAVRIAGDWNRMTILCRGDQISVMLNGEVVNSIDLANWISADQNPDGSEIPSELKGRPWAELPKMGRIGLQGGHSGKEVEFRNLKLLRLP